MKQVGFTLDPDRLVIPEKFNTTGVLAGPKDAAWYVGYLTSSSHPQVVPAAARLQDVVDLDSARDDLATVVYRAPEPAHVSVWIGQDS